MTAWHVPGPWHGLILVLAAYRLTRLLGWDEWPPVERARAWLLGEEWVPDGDQAWRDPGWWKRGAAEVELPGKTPASPVERVRPAYRRPLLAHLFHCPFCLGWWVSLVVYLGWLAEPRWALLLLAPLALAGAVSLLAKNLDAV